MPDGMSFEEAAAIPHAGLLAYQALIEYAHIQPKEKVLVNGAGGGVGTYALQIAKMFDAEVTAVDHSSKREALIRLGYDHFIDYQKNDFTKNGKIYDLILDARTTRSPWLFPGSLSKKGRFVTIGGNSWKLIQLVILKSLIRIFTGKKLNMLALKANKNLYQLISLYDDGIIKPLLDGSYPKEKIPQLINIFGEARHQGKIVVKW